ncbi:MAG: acyl-CoA thioesterase, partial [Cytophagia bacterium]|nr:acyl-CoA thioesterase [Cytophagia bacterium]
VRVESENIQTGVIKHCNSSYFTMVAKGDNGENVEVPGLILNDSDSLRRFARSITRQEQSKKRVKSFTPEEFVVDEYLEVIKEHNAQIEL